MSEEQKEGIVVNPFHKGAEAPTPATESDPAAPPEGTEVNTGEGEPGNEGTSEQSNSDGAPSSTEPNQSNSQPPQNGGLPSSPSDQTATAATTSSAQSSDSNSQPAEPAIVTGTIVPGSVVTPVATVTPVAPVTPDVPAVRPDEPAVIVKEESVVLDAIQTGISDVDQVVERLMKDASIEAKIIINTIKDYIVTMKPGKPVPQKAAIGQQVAFYNAILSAINNLEGDFRPTMQSILALMHAHKDGAFKETHVFRYIDSVPLSTDHRAGWRKLTTLLKTLANPATRQDLLRQINFDPLVKHGLSERGRTKLAAFFGK